MRLAIYLSLFGCGFFCCPTIGLADLTLTLDEPGISPSTNVSNFYFASDGVTLSSSGSPSSVFATTSGLASSNVFGWDNGVVDSHWGRPSSPSLNASFSGFLGRMISIDFLTDPGGSVTLQAFGTSGFLGSTTVSASPGLTFKTATLDVGSPLITNVQISMNGGPGGDFGLLDNFSASAVPEPSSFLLLSVVALGAVCRLKPFERWSQRSNQD